MLRIFGAIFVLFISVAPANAQNTFRTFQGTAFLTALASCPAIFSIGDYYTHVYRQKVGAADPADAMTFGTGRSIFRILSTDANGGLQGSVPTSNTVINNSANFAGGLTGSSSLTITSSAGAALTAANTLKYVGTINDFFGNPGCVVTIRSVGVLRPDI